MFIVIMATRNTELGKIKKNRHKIFILIGETSSHEKTNPFRSNFPDALNIVC
jgi:hypothetical protein